MRAAFHLLLSPEVGVHCTTTQNKGTTSEVINPGLRDKARGVQMMRVRAERREVGSPEGRSYRDAEDLENMDPS